MAKQVVLSEDEQELEDLKRQVQTEAPEAEAVVEAAPVVEGAEVPEAEAEADDIPSQRIRGEDGKFKRVVPHQALHQSRQETKGEREARQKLERDFAEYKGRAEERLKFLMEAKEQAKTQAPADTKPQIPDFNVDPLGHMRAKQEAIDAQLAEMQKGSAQTREQQEMQVRQSRAIQALQAEEARFATVNTDYWQAAEHLQNMWIAEGKAAGIPEQMMPNLIRARMAEVIQAAQATNKSPAEIAYALAGARGYTKAAPEVVQPDVKLANLKKGTEAARSLGAGGSPQASATPTIDWLLSLGEDEFHTYKTKHPSEFRRLMEGAAH